MCKLVRELASAGLDFIKDDELNADPPYAPLAERVAGRHGARSNASPIATGKKAMYAFNISGDVDHMLRGHDLVKKHGGTCVMVSVNSVGFAALAHLRQHCELPIHGHRNNFGAMARHPLLGIGFTAYQKLCRLAGVDHLHVGGFNSKFYESNEEVARSIIDCLTPLFGDYRVMPAISSAQWAGSAVEIYAATKTIDVDPRRRRRHLAHPGGTAAGVRSMQQGWEAALAGAPLNEYAATSLSCAAPSKNSEVEADGCAAQSFCSPFTAMTSPVPPTRWKRWRLSGLRTVLFLSPPTPELLARKFPDLRCIGVAGTSRAMSPAEMDARAAADAAGTVGIGRTALAL